MKIGILKTKVIGPILLSLPMMCMHLGDDHHSGGHYSSLHREWNQPSIHGQVGGQVTEEGPVMIHREGQMEIEATDLIGQGN